LIPFASRELQNFASFWGFKITTSGPRYPQSNGVSGANDRNYQTAVEESGGSLHYIVGIPKYPCPRYWPQPRAQGLLLVQNGGSEKPLAKAANVAAKIR